MRRPKGCRAIATVYEMPRDNAAEPDYRIEARDGPSACVAVLAICRAMHGDASIPFTVRAAAKQFISAVAQLPRPGDARGH